MYETAEEVAALDALLDRSRAGATGHLQEIITDERAVTAAELIARFTGMRVLSLATVTAKGEPRVSAADGHFLHGTWSFSTAGDSAKARHMEARPSVSVAHIDGEEFALFSHGTVEVLTPEHGHHDETIAHWTAHYGSDPRTWGPDIRFYVYTPAWMVGYQAPPPR